MTRQDKIKRFKEFHAKNPLVYKMFKRYFIQLIDKSRGKPLGSKLAFERTKFEILTTHKVDQYKINNDFAPAYARLFIKENPAYKDLVKLKVSFFDGEV